MNIFNIFVVHPNVFKFKLSVFGWKNETKERAETYIFKNFSSWWLCKNFCRNHQNQRAEEDLILRFPRWFSYVNRNEKHLRPFVGFSGIWSNGYKEKACFRLKWNISKSSKKFFTVEKAHISFVFSSFNQANWFLCFIRGDRKSVV